MLAMLYMASHDLLVTTSGVLQQSGSGSVPGPSMRLWQPCSNLHASQHQADCSQVGLATSFAIMPWPGGALPSAPVAQPGLAFSGSAPSPFASVPPAGLSGLPGHAGYSGDGPPQLQFEGSAGQGPTWLLLSGHQHGQVVVWQLAKYGSEAFLQVPLPVATIGARVDNW